MNISQGDERLFRQALQQAKQALQKALKMLTTGYNSTEMLDMPKIAEDIQNLANDLIEAMATKKTRDKREAKKEKASRN